MANVKLKKEHLQKVAEIMIMVVEWKSASLNPKSWETFETIWLPKLLEQLNSNEWTCNRTSKNSMLWIIDQVRHSKRLAPGVNPKNAVHLDDTKLGREVIEICKAASKGQLWYEGWAKNSEFNNLFQ